MDIRNLPGEEMVRVMIMDESIRSYHAEMERKRLERDARRGRSS